MENKKTDKFFKIILIVLAILFFFLYSFLPLMVGPVFNSPDGNANYIFSKIFAERNELKIFEPLNRYAGGIIHPRSTSVADAFIVPGSFLGMILLYGALGKVFGIGSIIFLTPFFAVVGVLFFYGFLKRIFNYKIAFISSLLLFIHPAFWYYASRTMMHNVLFLVFFIASLYFFILIKESNRWIWYFLGGLFAGSAFAVRSSEIIWMILFFCLFAAVFYRVLKGKFIPLAIFGFILAFVPIFCYQYAIYGDPLRTGYADSGAFSLTETPDGARGVFARIFLPFGFDARNIGKNFINYFLTLFPWFSAAEVLGAIFFFAKFFKRPKNHYIYFGAWILFSLWLFIYYGSWNFHDHPDPQAISIGTSYIRYWLPAFVFGLPLVALFIDEASKFLKNKWLRNFLAAALILSLSYFSARVVFFGTDESILSIKNNLTAYAETKEKILSLTEEDSVVIAGYFDKILWPERKVVYDIVSEYNESKLPAVVAKYPTYLYSLFPERDINYLNEKKLLQYNLEIAPYEDLRNGQKLMKVILKNPKSQILNPK